MQKEEIYQINKTCFLGGLDYKGHQIIIDRVETCSKLCSGRERLDDRVCKNQWVYFYILSQSEPYVIYDECSYFLESSVRPVLLKPDNLFEVF